MDSAKKIFCPSDLSLALHPKMTLLAKFNDKLLTKMRREIDSQSDMKEFNELVEIMTKLRKECPWDREQSLASLRSYLLEESAEVLEAMEDAITNQQYENLIEELGDLLLQILFQSEIISESTKQQEIRKVLINLKDKLIRRHPHVFSDIKLDKADEVLSQWEEIKDKEKSTPKKSLLEDIPKSFTALQRAHKLGKRSKKVGFDWKEPNEVWQKLLLELEELKKAKTPEHEEEELGDVLFCLAQWARHKNIDPEVALRKANTKFERRFQQIESHPNFPDLPIETMEELWNKAKADERKRN